MRGDPMIGTAPPQRRVLLVHQPGAWGPRGLVESRCDPEVARRIDAAAAAHRMRLQAIRRPGKHEPGVPIGGYEVGIADTTAAVPTITWWRVDDLSEIVPELEAGWPTRPPVAIDTQPLYLVCTHGKHDPCCALRGRPLAQALQQLRPGRAWETTHLGGDRFAANLLVLPAGDLYGRVPIEAAEKLVRAVEAGEVLPEMLRGRIGLTPAAQTALAFAHQELGVADRNALSVTALRWIDDTRAEATIAAADARFIVHVHTEVREGAQLTCHGPDNARARVYAAVAMREISVSEH
jgi:hypothetical protein